MVSVGGLEQRVGATFSDNRYWRGEPSGGDEGRNGESNGVPFQIVTFYLGPLNHVRPEYVSEQSIPSPLGAARVPVLVD